MTTTTRRTPATRTPEAVLNGTVRELLTAATTLTPQQVLDLTVRDLYRYAHSIGRNPHDVLREALRHL